MKMLKTSLILIVMKMSIIKMMNISNSWKVFLIDIKLFLKCAYTFKKSFIRHVNLHIYLYFNNCLLNRNNFNINNKSIQSLKALNTLL